MYSSTHSVTSAIDGGEWSASRPGRFTHRERAPGTHWIGGWVGRKWIHPEKKSGEFPLIQPATLLPVDLIRFKATL
jgi:hypothetical protein